MLPQKFHASDYAKLIGPTGYGQPPNEYDYQYDPGGFGSVLCFDSNKYAGPPPNPPSISLLGIPMLANFRVEGGDLDLGEDANQADF